MNPTYYKSLFSNLNPDNRNVIYSVLQEVYSVYEICEKPDIIIDWLPPDWRNPPPREQITKAYRDAEYEEIVKRQRALHFLKRHWVLMWINVTTSDPANIPDHKWHIELKIYANNLQRAIEIVKNSVKLNTSKSKTGYKIEYTFGGEVVLNGKILSKTNFDGENDRVFQYIYDNANKKITLKELEKANGGKLRKSLHKIVENLGFNANQKKLFFNISKTCLVFRNPIAKK